MNKLAPFNTYQTEYINKCKTNWLNIAHGGKRGGKNVIQTLAFCIALENHPDKIHLVSAFSVSSALLNVATCDGYGIQNYFHGRYKLGKFNERNALFLNTRRGRKIVLFTGGGKDNDEKRLKGNSYGMAYITEANECTPNFINEVFDRTISSSDRKIFHDLNPKAPRHWYYDMLAFHQDKQNEDPNYGLNYAEFNIYDNHSLSEEQLKNIIKTYDQTTIWFKRDILGERIASEGTIYTTFANNPNNYIINEVNDRIIFATIGVDFGGTKSGHAFVLTGFTKQFKKVITLDEFYTKEEIDPKQLEEYFVEFVKKARKKYNVNAIYMDSAEQVLIRGLKNALKNARIGVKINNALKGSIIERIKFYNMLFANDRYRVMSHCTHLINSFCTSIWKENNSMSDERLDDGSINIDMLDSQEYSTERYQKIIIDLIHSGK